MSTVMVELPVGRQNHCQSCGRWNIRPVTVESLAKFPAHLTPKERRIVVLVCSGLSHKEIARRIDTTEQVIKNTLHRMYPKIGCRGRHDLIIRMFRFKYEGI